MSADEHRRPGRPRDPDLESRRREQILEAAARTFASYGFANTQVQTIANRLGIGVRTVETHRANILSKLDIRTIPELMRLWMHMH